MESNDDETREFKSIKFHIDIASGISCMGAVIKAAFRKQR
jgi:hypothetical protein